MIPCQEGRDPPFGNDGSCRSQTQRYPLEKEWIGARERVALGGGIHRERWRCA